MLIALGVAGKLDLLRNLWEVVLIPPEVLKEVGVNKPGYTEVMRAVSEGWLKVGSSDEKGSVVLPLAPTSGEAKCLLLAKKMKADLVLIGQPPAHAYRSRLRSDRRFRSLPSVLVNRECLTRVKHSDILHSTATTRLGRSPGLWRLVVFETLACLAAGWLFEFEVLLIWRKNKRGLPMTVDEIIQELANLTANERKTIWASLC